METKNLNSWIEFEKEIENINALIQEFNKKSKSYVSKPLFRGQCDHAWHLKTTIERLNKKAISLSEYYDIISEIKLIIESHSNKNWPRLKKFKEPKKIIDLLWMSPSGYEFMAYLRHFGFPSPLIDWTYSPYIAAYFAFSDLNSKKNVAIYAYIEDTGQGKEFGNDTPLIIPLTHGIKTHKRHHIQQSEYTYCLKEKKSKFYYWNHEEAFTLSNDKQNLLKKFILPISERAKVLKKLDQMNINAYSLFGDEDNLMNMLSIKEFIIKHL